MADRQAMALVADDMMVSVGGKITLNGIYTGYITILSDPSPVSQLVVMFLMEGDRDDPLTSLTIEVTAPGNTPVRQEFASAPAPNFQGFPEAKKWVARFPVVLSQIMLKPGRMSAKITDEKGEMSVSLPWIVTATQMQELQRSGPVLSRTLDNSY